ncbi:MAG: hypothetical protein AAFN77_13005 [Planctomycetota bacterium]
MRIVYVASLDPNSERGALQKVQMQTSAWRRMGHSVYLIWDTRSDYPFPDENDGDNIDRVYHAKNLLEKWKNSTQVAADLKPWNPDLIYVRFASYNPIVTRLKTIAPIVFEINGNDKKKNQKLSLPKRVYRFLTRDRYLNIASGLVYVTRELSRMPIFPTHQPGVAIRNSMDVSGAVRHETDQRESPCRQAVFIGDGAPWHGMDRVVELAKALPDWTFHIICPRELPEVPQNVVEHGAMQREEYEKVFQQCSVAVGAMALGRGELKEACSLKVLEYIFYALPFVVSYEETDFTDQDEFMLTLSETGPFVDNAGNALPEIQSFFDKWSVAYFDNAEALEKIDLQRLEQRRLDFFSTLIEGAAD